MSEIFNWCDICRKVRKWRVIVNGRVEKHICTVCGKTRSYVVE